MFNEAESNVRVTLNDSETGYPAYVPRYGVPRRIVEKEVRLINLV
jgi:hypothetical protein